MECAGRAATALWISLSCAHRDPKRCLPMKSGLPPHSKETRLRLHSRIDFDDSFGCVVFAVHRQLYVVSAGFEQRAQVEEAAEAAAATSATTAAKPWRQISGTRRSIAPQVPLHPVQA